MKIWQAAIEAGNHGKIYRRRWKDNPNPIVASFYIDTDPWYICDYVFAAKRDNGLWRKLYRSDWKAEDWEVC